LLIRCGLVQRAAALVGSGGPVALWRGVRGRAVSAAPFLLARVLISAGLPLVRVIYTQNPDVSRSLIAVSYFIVSCGVAHSHPLRGWATLQRIALCRRELHAFVARNFVVATTT
jgi:hypothetical protein